ncbi:MAG TPA: DNA gyrase inhibitor YacG [Beijerinckiaceae bacterium]
MNDYFLDGPPAEGGAAGGKCPICGKPTKPASRPFCSRRCADVDLHRWLSGAYVVPAAEDEDRPGDDPEESGRA